MRNSMRLNSIHEICREDSKDEMAWTCSLAGGFAEDEGSMTVEDIYTSRKYQAWMIDAHIKAASAPH
jgi:hypothetical protein